MQTTRIPIVKTTDIPGRYVPATSDRIIYRYCSERCLRRHKEHWVPARVIE